jgi:hypothetical protein
MSGVINRIEPSEDPQRVMNRVTSRLAHAGQLQRQMTLDMAVREVVWLNPSPVFWTVLRNGTWIPPLKVVSRIRKRFRQLSAGPSACPECGSALTT